MTSPVSPTRRYLTIDLAGRYRDSYLLAGHKEQASMIRRYIIWRNNHAYDERSAASIEME